MSNNPAWLKAHGRPWGRKAERPIYDNPWIRVTEYDAVAPTGRDALYGLVHMKNLALAVLPLHEDATVTLVGQNRFAVSQYSWEIPEGGGSLDVDPLTSAQRELREETGMTAATWRRVLDLHLSNSVTDERAVGYLATDLSPGATDFDPTEDIVVVRAPFAEALAAALAGEIVDALTVAMLLRCHHMAVTGDLPSSLARRVLG